MASKQSQRIAARQQLQQRMAEKADRERKSRTVWWSIGGVGALVALVLVAWIAFNVFSSDDEDEPDAAAQIETTPPATEPGEEEPAVANDAPIEDTVAAAEEAAGRCDDAQPSGEGAAVETSGATDGQPATDVYLECMSLSVPDASATAECAYGSTGGDAVPATIEPAAGSQTMSIVTNLGTITAEIDTANAPCTAGSFTYLAGQGYFDGSQCHRLTTDGIWVLQCGDPDARAAIEAGTPEGAGMGGPGYQMGDENLPADAEGNYPAGTLAMANAGAGTTGSQFFIVYEDSTLNPAAYTVLGQITEGLDIVEDVAAAGVM